MGKGLDKAAKALLDLEPTAILDLFIIYPDIVNEPSVYAPIHAGAIFNKGVIWQGLTYIPVSMEIEGFEVSADGRINRPKIKISNKDYFITTMLRKYGDFKNARISRKRTLVKFLDDENFEGGNPFGGADPSAEISEQQYIISQKTQENKIFVEFELTSPMDLENFEINYRKIVGKYCYWKYRGEGCQYAGPAIQREDGKPFLDVNDKQIATASLSDPREYNVNENYTTGDVVYKTNNRVMVSDPNGYGAPSPLVNYFVAKTDVQGLDPEKYENYWDKDGCNKKLSSCKLRFTQDQIVTRFVGTVEVEKIVSRIRSYSTSPAAWTHVDFTPRKQLPFLQTLSGKGGWTMSFNFTNNPRFGGRNQSFYLNTHTNYFYDGINLTHYERNDHDYWYWKDPAGYNRYMTIYPTDAPSVQGQVGYRFVIRVEEGNSGISHYNPTNKVLTKSPYHINPNQTYNIFRVLTDGRDLGWNSSTNNAGIDHTVEGVCFWDRVLSDEEIEASYNRLNNGAVCLKQYQDIENSEVPIVQGLKDGLLAWWEKPYEVEGETGIEDSSPNKNDLVYEGWDMQFSTIKRFFKYRYSVNENVSNTEELSYLPFGGFPGTDGFGFMR